MDHRKQKLIMYISMGILALMGIVLLVFGCVYKESTFVKISAIVSAVICLILSAELAYIVFFAGDTNPNFFLYDPNTRRNIPQQKLTFSIINAKMNRYMASYAKSEGKLWTDKILDDPEIDMGDEFKPVVSYKLLFDLAEKDVENGWKCFELSSDGTVEFICRAIEENGDVEMASNIRKMKSLRPYNSTYIRDYLVRNRKYLQSRLFKYVYENIDRF